MGNIFVGGNTGSANFPGIDIDSADSDFASGEAFIAKLNPGLTSILAATYLGGSGLDRGGALILDENDNVYIAGDTSSIDFPGVNMGSADNNLDGSSDAFIAKLDSDLSAGSPDNDGDGIPDDEDDCLDSDTSTTVIIDGCDSGISNFIDGDGCSISDLIAQIAASATNHGNFVSEVSNLLNDLKWAGILSGSDKGAIQSCAGGAIIP